MAEDHGIEHGEDGPKKRISPVVIAAAVAGGLVAVLAIAGITTKFVLGALLPTSKAALPVSQAAAGAGGEQAVPSSQADQPPGPSVSPNRNPTEQQRLWALAAGAPLAQANGERHDTLAGVSLTDENREIARSGLRDWWGVSDRADLLETLDWLEAEGHRAGFAELQSMVGSATPAELAALQKRVSDDPAASAQLQVVLAHGERLGAKAISGWDFSRYIFLCRRGYLVGYLTEEEAWVRIMGAAQRLQLTFSSWEELGENYLIGREFWSPAQMARDGQVFRDAHSALLSDPESPWLTVPWSMDLAEAAP